MDRSSNASATSSPPGENWPWRSAIPVWDPHNEYLYDTDEMAPVTAVVDGCHYFVTCTCHTHPLHQLPGEEHLRREGYEWTENYRISFGEWRGPGWTKPHYFGKIQTSNRERAIAYFARYRDHPSALIVQELL